MKDKHRYIFHILLFWLPSIIIFISILALIYGSLSLNVLKNYAEITTIAILFFWFPIIMIFINGLLVIYGITLLDVNIYAKSSLISSLFLFVPALNIFTSILAIVFGVVFFNELKKDKNQRGRGLAIAGITISAVTILLSLLGSLIYYFFPQLLK